MTQVVEFTADNAREAIDTVKGSFGEVASLVGLSLEDVLAVAYATFSSWIFDNMGPYADGIASEAQHAGLVLMQNLGGNLDGLLIEVEDVPTADEATEADLTVD